MPKILLVLYPDFTEFEIAIATQLLARKFSLISAASERTVLRSEAGIQVMPHLPFAEVVPADFEALLVPAAPDMGPMLASPPILDLIRAFDQQHPLIGAICGAGMLLAKAGILRHRVYTVSLYRRYRDRLGCFDEAHFRNEAVIEMENLITAQGFAYAEFGLRFAKRLTAIRDPAGAEAYYTGKGDIHWEE